MSRIKNLKTLIFHFPLFHFFTFHFLRFYLSLQHEKRKSTLLPAPQLTCG